MVLFDSGASGDWVIWDGCTEDVCGTRPYNNPLARSRVLRIFICVNLAGHLTYSESKQHFFNFSIVDVEVFGDGGEANTLDTWRVNDTLGFVNISIPSTTFGAAFHIPTGGEGLDGNFGIAKGCVAHKQNRGYTS